jgi:alpha-L-fucosidase 2
MKTHQKKMIRLFIITGALSFLYFIPGLTQQPSGGAVISSVFNPKTAVWNLEWPGKISQYDLAYLSPPIDPMQGIPLGNGDIGVLVWCEESKIIAVVNKSDLWDDATFGPFHNHSGKEEDYSTTQRHACRIIIDFKFPVFNTFYLSGFKGKLNLADASLSIEAISPFGKVSLKAFVDHKSGVLFYELGSDLNEDVPVDIVVERFGSRNFSHWFSQINRDASIGLSGTEAIADDNNVYITQKLTGGTFAAGGSVIKNDNLIVKYSREHSRSAVIQLTGARQKNVQLAFSVTSPVDIDAVSEVRNKLSSIHEKGIEPFRRSNEEIWKGIWNRSFMDYGDDYLNNLWYLTMYYLNASQGGKYPGRFINGLWGWSRDVQNWNFYFHQNQQELYWPLNAAGFHELVSPYLDYRFNSLPQAKKDAKEFLHANGAFFSDVTERRGYNSSGEKDNHTPVAEIALDFWRQYRYTGDKNFLKDKALPFILEAARFFESLLVKETDGLYHAKEGTGYEGWIKLKDGLTELVYARVIFTTALEALKVADTDLPEAKKWREIVSCLAPLPVIKQDETTIVKDGTGFKLNRGFFKGETSPSNEIMAAGWGIKENKWLNVYYPADDTIRYGLNLLDGIFPTVPCSPVFPSGLIGLTQKGSVLFDQMTTTSLLYGSEGTGWDPVPIVLARLGLARELAADLERFPGRWQIYCNGWGHWGLEYEVYGKDYHNITKDAECFFRTYEVRDVASNEKLPLRMWPLRHTSMEAMSVLATAMNESLLQSYDGILRIAPAFPANKTGRFTLHAVGGFIVSSEIKSGEVLWISIKSLFGNPCKLELPWRKAVVQSTLKKNSQTISGNIVEIKTKANEIIMILPEGKDLGSWSVVSEGPKANENVKYHSSGKRQLGIPRMF